MTTSLFPRSSGILLHPTSLPSPFGVGDLGPVAYEFLDFLEAAGQSLWQVLPLGPTGYGDSPYQCFSAFAGNPLLISLERLHEQGLLDATDLEDARLPYAGNVDFPLVIHRKTAALRKAAAAFRGSPAFDEFRDRNKYWLPDFARFMAFKEQFGMVAWPDWHAAAQHPDEERVRVHTFLQFEFFEQWLVLKREANGRGIRVMGDLPIYAAGDSSDVWAQPTLWKLREDGHPALMAGVPPDYFSATGQLWGNPIYDWDAHAASGYAWWIERFRSTFELFDLVRVDHFRGFQAYFQVPFGENTAVNGEWVEGPGAALFEAVEKALARRLAVVAENLGVITPEVEAIRNRFGFPGMAILQFAFGKDPQAPDFKPHNYPRGVVAYTGTHDNDTVMGWWNSEGGDSTRTAEDIRKEKAFALAYLGADGSEMNWSLIRALMASVADTVVFPVQDLLGLGKQARMNTPATLGGNWKYRLLPGQLDHRIADRLRGFAVCYDRV
ncbi:MAG TPA: 4-alpha-glucanotransferase [Bryobacteraceae bacterium]|nr:4-alpha-glucanotransferase [Bryobacteraceae bacterium]